MGLVVALVLLQPFFSCFQDVLERPGQHECDDHQEQPTQPRVLNAGGHDVSNEDDDDDADDENGACCSRSWCACHVSRLRPARKPWGWALAGNVPECSVSARPAAPVAGWVGSLA